jgi:uncharacterized protein (DUF169 family)
MHPREAARILTDALALTLPPIAVCFSDRVPADVPAFEGRLPAGCAFWQEATRRTFATAPRDHDLCAIGTFTHNLEASAAHEVDRRDALAVFAELRYVRAEDVPLIPTLPARHRHVIYGPLSDAPLAPDVVLMFVRPSQALILAEAAESVDGGLAPSMGRPACAIVPQAVNSGRAALSLGCCGARAYLDVLAADVALYALPGPRIADYARRIEDLAKANSVLAAFHALRRRDVEAGRAPTIKESLARLGQA